MVVQSLVMGAGGFPPRAVSEEERAAGRAPFAPLPSVAGAVREVAQALGRAGVSASPPLLDPDRDEVLTAWKQAQTTAGEQPLIVHFSGHGVPGAAGGLYLVVRGTEPAAERVRATAVEVDAMLRDVEDGAGGPVLFLLDVCGGGRALASQLAHQIAGRDRRTWVIAACAADESTHGARFSQATARVLNRLARGWMDISPALAYVPVDALAAEIDRELARGDGQQAVLDQTVVRTPYEEAVLAPPPFFANPSHAGDAVSNFMARTDAALRQFAVESDPGLDLMHFALRAAGTRHAEASLFSGRRPQLKRLAEWLDLGDEEGSRNRLRVVTGGPGSGKSAILGVAVCVTRAAAEPCPQPCARLPAPSAGCRARRSRPSAHYPADRRLTPASAGRTAIARRWRRVRRRRAGRLLGLDPDARSSGGGRTDR
ncbi:hypothetical protein ABZT03_31285 [Streptomyces sp. NPDC005574]|uniref:hypothetical protein n=1 Tax=Streptomyces sp. NPDC005574 TaxID=3156891 RepID=UPI0033B20ECB